MKSKPGLIVVGILFSAVACARKEQAPAAAAVEPASTAAEGVEKTYPLRGKVVSRGSDEQPDHRRSREGRRALGADDDGLRSARRRTGKSSRPGLDDPSHPARAGRQVLADRRQAGVAREPTLATLAL